MNDSFTPFPFEQYPRQPLVLRVVRRQFFQEVFETLYGSVRESGGKPAFRLPDLGVFSDEQLAEIVPEVLSDSQISLQDGFVWAKTAQTVQPTRLFPVDSPALAAFNLFNGMNTLTEAGRQFAQQMGWTPERGFAYLRGVFLWLVQSRVCRPKSP